MVDTPVPPFRRSFDAARDPLTARNALGITTGGSGLITAVTAPLAVTGGNLTVDLSGYQPLDADLTAIAALTGTNTIYYRSAADTWSAVTVGSGLSFAGGTLAGIGSTIPSNFLGGLTLSNGSDATNDIDIATGAATDTSNAVVMQLTGGLTKQLDAAWAVGTNAGGRDTGSIADGTWHVWLIRRSDTGVVDALFSLSATAPTMPANYDQKRRIGSIIRQTTILAFNQAGDRFYYTTSILDVNVSNQGNSRVLRTMTVPPSTVAMMRGYSNNATVLALSVVQPAFETDAVPSISAVPLTTIYAAINVGGANGYFEVPVDASSQIGTRAGAASTTLRIVTIGWIDNRGK